MRFLFLLTSFLLFLTNPAHAQYRDNGLLLEVGGETHDVLPLTLMNVVGSEVAHRAWYEGRVRNRLPPKPTWLRSCGKDIARGRGLPCEYDWMGITDGPILTVGYQRVLGDLLLDLSEQPILKNLVLTYRASLGIAGTLPVWEPLTPVFPVGLLHQEVGLRWNVWDEKLRPYVGLNVGMTAMLNPVRTLTRVQEVPGVCERVERREEVAVDEVCVRDAQVGPSGPTSVDPNAALFLMHTIPVFVGARPELGVEYFLAEDISVQLSGSAAVRGTVLPEYLLKAPFAGVSARVGAAVVAYF
ncbi:MAG: hypothetical protein AB2A00_07190 [Myxococcota bacterium]